MLTLYEFLLMNMPSSMSFYSFDQLYASYLQNWWQFIWIGIDSTRLPREICSDKVVDQQTILYQRQVGKTSKACKIPSEVLVQRFNPTTVPIYITTQLSMCSDRRFFHLSPFVMQERPLLCLVTPPLAFIAMPVLRSNQWRSSEIFVIFVE